jgi:hypothetical protein
MERHVSVPHRPPGWPPPLLVGHKVGEDAPFHYHEVEEWLEVEAGEITFFPAGELAGHAVPSYTCVKGDVLRIPQGEIHRVTIGPAGVTYRMWTPVPSGPCFQRKLDPDLEDLIRRNLELPAVENHYDERIRNPRLATPQGVQVNTFLDEFVSEALVMRTAGGSILDRRAYLTRGPADITRYPSDSVRILHKTPDPTYPDHESVLLSTVVHTRGGSKGPLQITNLRLFDKEGGRTWKCRVWMNYPEPGVEGTPSGLRAS